jgi:hypothetical protein
MSPCPWKVEPMFLNFSGHGWNFSFRGGPWFFATLLAVLVFLSLVLGVDTNPLLNLAETVFRRT